MITAEIVQQARGRVGFYADEDCQPRPGIIRCNGMVFTSEMPNGDGEAESINLTMRRLLEAVR